MAPADGSVEKERIGEEFSEAVIVRVGDSGGHHQRVRARSVMGSVTMLMLAMPDCLRVSITDGENAEGNGFVAAEEDAFIGLLELRVDLGAEVVDVDGIVAEIDQLLFVDADDHFLFVDFLDALGLRDVELDAGLQDRRGDHEDDQQHEDDVDERDHVDLGQRRLGRVGELRHILYMAARLEWPRKLGFR